jgi:valyl-tRNA synthetase
VFNLDGTLNETIDGTLPAKYAGLDRFEARKQIVADFDEAGLLVSVDDHALKVPKGDRSGTDHRAVADRPVVRVHQTAGRTGHRGG